MKDRCTRLAVAIALGTSLCSCRLGAQTGYYNTDRGRPVQVEDAHVTERYALELKLAPVRVERAQGGIYHWGIDPEIAFGFLPRTQVEVGVPLVLEDAPGARRSGVAGFELSLMHTLNAETEGLPAFGVRADLLLPAGNLAPSRAYPTVTGMATRTFTMARVHVNGQLTAGPALTAGTSADAGAAELSRWLAGAAIDKAFPLRSLLITAELYGRKPLMEGEDVEFSSGVGARQQVSPTLALDAGIGRRLNGDSAGWYLTFGSAYSFSLASLFPRGR